MAGNQSSEDGLRYLNDEEATKRIPVMIYLGLVSLVGLAGNVHVLVVFGVCYKTSNFRCFVLCLAALDTMSCVVAMPFEIFDMRYPYMFSASDVCSAFRYTNTVLAVSSAMILVAIAAERFRKICQPFKKQLTVNRAKAMCVITLLASALFCIPAALSQGLSTVDLGKNITGHDCSVKDSVRATSLPIVEAIMGLFGAVAIIISLIVMYSCIATHLIRHKNRLSRHINGHVPTSGNNRCNINSASPTNTNEETNSNEVMEDDSNMSESSGPSEDVKIENSSLKFKGDEKTSRISSQEFSNTKNCMESGKKTFKFATEYTSKTTVIFFMLTAIFIMSFLPRLILACVVAFKENYMSNLTETQAVLHRIAMRLYFLNNAANPLIYGIYGLKFRNRCKLFYERILCFKK